MIVELDCLFTVNICKYKYCVHVLVYMLLLMMLIIT